MNKIVFAGKNADGERQNKYLEIILSDDNVIVVPPYCDYRAEGADFLRVLIDQAVMPLKEVTHFKDDGGVRQAAELAAQFFGVEKSEAVMQALGNLLVSLVCFYKDKSKFSPVVELVRTDIAKNVSNPAYVLEDYLKRLPLSYDYVRKLFQKETGATPRTYLESARMELAANIIASGVQNKYSEYSVSQVAEACGFSDTLYFSRVFKKHFGVAPKEFKQ